MITRITLAVALASLTQMCRDGFAAVPHWPQFHGVNSQGFAQNDKPPVEFGPGTNLLWKTVIPPGVSSPCVWGDRIFLTGAEGENLDTVCLGRSDGKVLWQKSVAAEAPRELHKRNHRAASTPATDGKSVCVYHGTFGLISYDFEGHELWRNPMPGLLARNGSGTSPGMLNGRLVLICDVEGGKSFVAAFDPATGKEFWRTRRPSVVTGYTSPILWQHDAYNDVVVVGSLRVTGYDLASGKERWHIGGTEAISVCPTPVIGDGLLHIMSRSMSGMKMPGWTLFALGIDKDRDGKISRAEIPKQFIEQGMFNGLDHDEDGFVVEKEWQDTVTMLEQGDYGIFALKPPGAGGPLTTNQVAWKHRKGVASVSSPLFYRGKLYCGQDGGRVTCFDATSGTKFYEQERLGADGEYYASPVAANGHIYYCSTKGVVTVTAAGDELKVVRRNALEEPIYATPAIVADTLIIRGSEHLWAFKGE